MRAQLIRIAAIASSAVLLAAPSRMHAQSADVRSLDAARPALRTPEARAAWDREMAGRTPPDLLGETRRAGLDERQLRTALLPSSERGHATLLGAKVWPRHPGRLVAIACVTDAAPRFDHGPDCSGIDDSQRIYLGVLQVGDGGEVRTLARLGPLAAGQSGVLPPLRWNGRAGTDLPIGLEDAQGDAPATTDVAPPQWERFDLADYRLAADAPAFGLRGGWSEGYAGGGATFSALYLLELRGNALRPVFGAPISMFKNLAGDWNDDGTRQHHLEEAANVLLVRPHRHGGYPDLQVRRRGAKSGDTYRWNAALARYAPQP